MEASGSGTQPVVREVRETDQGEVHDILMSPHVLAGSMRVPHSRLEMTRARLNQGAGVHQVVAEVDGHVIGFGELITEPDEPRQSHVGDINMVATRADRQGQGVGRAVAEALVDLGFNWLNLSRLGLIVFTDNGAAIKLYESLGFEIEGTMPRLGFGAGEWMDAHMMGLLRDP